MRAVVQRVNQASLVADGVPTCEIGIGLVAFIGIHREDELADARVVADRLAKMRVFNDEDGKINLSVLDLRARDVDARVLLVPNFTLYGDTTQRRPSFGRAAGFEAGKALFEELVSILNGVVPTACGVFGADMQILVGNDGPVTVIVETRTES